MPNWRGDRGHWSSTPRGKGRGRGRGGRGRGRGRGRGSPRGFQENPQSLINGSEGHERTVIFDGDFEDFNLDHIMQPSGIVTPGSERGRRGHQTPSRGVPSGNGYSRGGRAMRGIGFPNSRRQQISLSVLERDRPLLQPVRFVRGEHQKTLFEEVEEILRSHEGTGGDFQESTPSATVVERIFRSEELAQGDRNIPGASVRQEAKDDVGNEMTVSQHDRVDIDILRPGVVQQVSENIVEGEAAPIPEVSEEDVIVYVAPYPRIRQRDHNIHSSPVNLVTRLDPPQSSPKITPMSETASPSPHGITAPSAVDSALDVSVRPTTPAPVYTRRRIDVRPTRHTFKIGKKEYVVQPHVKRKARFRVTEFGRDVLKQNTDQKRSIHKLDPRRAERRNDSDVDWGTEEDGGVDNPWDHANDMDQDEEIDDIAALIRFSRGVEGLTGKNATTIADLEDGARIEDEDNGLNTDQESTSQEGTDTFDVQVRGDENPEIVSSDSWEETPRRNYKGRLKRLRGKTKARSIVDDGDSDEGAAFSWADRDESFIDNIDDMLDENLHLLYGRNRKARKQLFKALRHGDPGHSYEPLNLLNVRKKDRHIPIELLVQWERDRTKKAERKRSRALARMEASEDLSFRRRGTKKQRDKVLGGARVDGATIKADLVHDMASLEQLLRAFIDNLDVQTMVLPPKNKEWRKRAHMLAETFHLKSKSRGTGEGRFITLIKTSRSGIGINEQRISSLLGNNGGSSRTSGRVVHRHRDGDEVGKMAPRLSESNIGFRLLQQMGWAEGERIGATGGLVDPLTAIIKTTKLGLGASR